MIKDSVESFFKENYSPNPVMIKSPGRVNIIGEHTDYNLGFVLPASIEKAIYFAMQVNNTSKFNIEAFLTLPEKISLDLEGNGPEFSCFWGKYFKAILEILNEKKYSLKGIDCVFGGDIPIGSGLSSSAALCCGFTLAISEILDLNISREEGGLHYIYKTVTYENKNFMNTFIKLIHVSILIYDIAFIFSFFCEIHGLTLNVVFLIPVHIDNCIHVQGA